MTFDSLDFVVIDASALFSIQSDLLIKIVELPNVSVCVAKTFKAVFLNVDHFISDDRLVLAKQNYNIITKKIKIFTHSSDIYDLACFLSREKEKLTSMVISTDEMLIERIIINNICVHIYNPERNKTYIYRSFASLGDVYSLTNSKSIISYDCDACEESSLFTVNGKITLLSKKSEGTESRIFSIKEIPDKIVKIYKQKFLTLDKISNIERLRVFGATSNIDWCTFPIDIVYSDDQKTQPIGYIMKFHPNIKMLSEVMIYKGNTNDILPNYRFTRISDTVDICIKVVRQILYLNMHGILISDFNDNNFAFFTDSSNSNILFLDTDSFGHKDYFSDCRANYDYVHDYSFGRLNKSDAILFSQEALYIFIFKLFTLGMLPIAYKKFRFRDDRKNHDFDYKWNLVPANLQTLFYKVFQDKTVCSVDELLYELILARNNLQGNSKLNQTYRMLCSEQIYPFRADDVFETTSGVIFTDVDSTHRKVIRCSNAISGVIDVVPEIKKEEWQKSEVVLFVKNTDNTYYIQSLEDKRFLSLSGTIDTPILSFSVTQSPSYSEKWRIQKESTYIDAKGYTNYSCKIGSEYYPQIRLVIDENGNIKAMSKYNNATSNDIFKICLITDEQHCMNNPSLPSQVILLSNSTTNAQSNGNQTATSNKSQLVTTSNFYFDKIETYLENLLDNIETFFIDSFSPGGKRWNTIGKPILIILGVIIALCIIMSSCEKNNGEKNNINTIDVSVENAEKVEKVLNTLIFDTANSYFQYSHIKELIL